MKISGEIKPSNFNCDNFIDDACYLVDRFSIDLASMTQNFDINHENMVGICTNFIDGFADIVYVHAPLKIAYLAEDSRNKN